MANRGLVSFPKEILDDYESFKLRLATDSGRQVTNREALAVLMEVAKDNYSQALNKLAQIRGN